MDLKLEKVDLSNPDVQLEIFNIVKNWGRHIWIDDFDVFENKELIPFIKEIQPKLKKIRELEKILLANPISNFELSQGRRYYLSLRGKIEKEIFALLSYVHINGTIVYFNNHKETCYYDYYGWISMENEII